MGMICPFFCTSLLVLLFAVFGNCHSPTLCRLHKVGCAEDSPSAPVSKGTAPPEPAEGVTKPSAASPTLCRLHGIGCESTPDGAIGTKPVQSHPSDCIALHEALADVNAQYESLSRELIWRRVMYPWHVVVTSLHIWSAYVLLGVMSLYLMRSLLQWHDITEANRVQRERTFEDRSAFPLEQRAVLRRRTEMVLHLLNLVPIFLYGFCTFQFVWSTYENWFQLGLFSVAASYATGYGLLTTFVAVHFFLWYYLQPAVVSFFSWNAAPNLWERSALKERERVRVPMVTYNPDVINGLLRGQMRMSIK